MTKRPLRNSLRSILSCALLAASAGGLSSCSSHDVAERQSGISGIHQGMIERREARQEARDERFRSSRESWMN
jgi:hypothetical protein